MNLQGSSDPLHFYVVAMEGDEVIDAAPTLKAKRVFDDVTNLVFVTFEVDATGNSIPLMRGMLFPVASTSKVTNTRFVTSSNTRFAFSVGAASMTSSPSIATT